MKNMGEIITFQRKAKGMTQAELAEKMNVTDKAVSKWERNFSCPDVNSLPRLAEILDISVEELLNAKKVGDENSDEKNIIGIILKAIPLAMGVATVVLTLLKEIDSQDIGVMLGLGVACLAISLFDEKH